MRYYDSGGAVSPELNDEQNKQLLNFLTPQAMRQGMAMQSSGETPSPPAGGSPPPPPDIEPDTKIADSHPGLQAKDIPPDAYSQYLKGEQGQIDKFGPEQQAAVMQKLQQGYRSPGNVIAKGGATLADAIMQGVARAGSSGNLAAINERENQQLNRTAEMGKSLQEQKLKAQGEKERLEAMNAATPLGATEGKAAQFLAKQLWPKATAAQLEAIGQNPQSLKALLPLGVDLNKALAEIANTAEFRKESLANQRLGLEQTGEHERGEVIQGAARALESRSIPEKIRDAFSPSPESKALQSQISGTGHGIPELGKTFNGQKVTKVTKVK